MNHHYQRVAIAEYCYPQFPITEEGLEIRHQYPEGRSGPVFDYLNDLNAMHEAERMLRKVPTINLCGETPWQRYRYQLDMVSNYEAFHATSHQRAEAFLKAIGKWTQ